MVKNFREVFEKAKSKEPLPVVLAEAHDPAALTALLDAEEEGIAVPVLVGDAGKINSVLESIGRKFKKAEIVDSPDEKTSVEKAVELIRNGEAKILLKGKVQTGTLMKGVLDREKGLRKGSLLSDAFLFESNVEGNEKLLCITDGGINIAPDLNAKKQILLNAVEVYRRLGYEKPKVSCLSMVENVVEGHLPSEEAFKLQEMAKSGEIENCFVEGPLSLDLSISRNAAKKKGVVSDVAGEADILLCPEIVSANLLAKSTTYFANLPLGHIVMGATHPVLIPSRSDTPSAKLNSIALAVALF
ncbi:MAG: phosphate acyltransferase [Acidobacteriota bacterium]